MRKGRVVNRHQSQTSETNTVINTEPIRFWSRKAKESKILAEKDRKGRRRYDLEIPQQSK